MLTKLQLLKKKFCKTKSTRTKALDNSPQKKGNCLKIFITTPKKPNSAARKTVKVLLVSNKKITRCHIPGIKHSLQKYSTVLVRGARVRDLPSINYRIIRGKFDLKRVYDRTKARSKYGINKLDN
jgi:small subunit ribosomal protein S12